MSSHSAAPRLAILGCGFMGTAILQGLLNKDIEEGQVSHYYVCVRSTTSKQRLSKEIEGFEGRVTIGAQEAILNAAESADVVMLGCVPSDLNTLLSTPGLAECLRKRLVVSPLAGVSTSQLATALGSSDQGDDTKKSGIGRVIPSIGAKIGDSVTLVAKSDLLPSLYEGTVIQLFERVGSVVTVPEKQMDDATAIGAACHALMIHAVDAITDASVADGMDRSTAMQLAAQSLRSSSNLFCAGGMSPEQLKAAMSTPQGITINSVLNIQNANVPAGIAGSVRAAIRYARDM